MSSGTTSINLLSDSFLPAWPLHPQHLSPSAHVQTNMCNLTSLTLSPHYPTWAVPFIYLFPIPSSLFTPSANLNVFNSSATSGLFVSATVFNLFNIAVHVNLPFHSCWYTKSLLHPLHPACTLSFTSLMRCRLLWTVDPEYLNSLKNSQRNPFSPVLVFLWPCESPDHYLYSCWLAWRTVLRTGF